MIDPFATLSVAGGLVYLFMGGDVLVRGSISVARRLRIPAAVIGATVVALGTSLPEFVVSLLAARQGHGDIAMGNVVGSNIANVLIVLGVPALLVPLAAQGAMMRAHCVFMLLVSATLVGLAWLGPLGTWQGVLLLGVLAAAVLVTVTGRAPLLDLSAQEAEYHRTLGLPESQFFAWLFILFGAVFMPVGADLTVAGVSKLAADFGAPEAAIAASVVALGTSLPEVSVSILAAMHRQVDMAIGNVVGSNSLNILFVVGMTALISEVPVPAGYLRFDLWFMLGCAVVPALLAFSGATIGRRTGLAFLGVYLFYLWAIY